MRMRAAIYTRISDDKAGDEAGVGRQREDCEAVCAREGWTVVDRYTDNSRSAFNGKPRPEFTRLLADAKDGLFDAVVAWRDDRLWRDVVEQQTVFRLLAAAGVQRVATSSRAYSTTSPDDSILSGIQALLGQHESAVKSLRLRRKAEELAKEGKMGGRGRRAFGYTPDRSALIEHEAALIREAAKRLLRGETASAIASDWNARGLRTPGSKNRPEGGPWRRGGLAHMMASPHLAGLRAHHGEVIAEAVWPAILTRDDHERLRVLLDNPPKTPRQPRARVALLAGGLARCGRCNRALRTGTRQTAHGNRRSYECRSEPGYPGCDRLSVLAEPVETYVRDLVLATLAGPGLAQALRDAAGDDTETAELTAQLAADADRLERLRDALADGDMDAVDFRHAKRRIADRMDANKRALTRRSSAGILAELPSDEAGLRALWEDARTTLDLRRAIVTAVVEEVVIGPHPRPGDNRVARTYERIQVRWRA
jgi:site-specific DNA recombinase